MIHEEHSTHITCHQKSITYTVHESVPASSNPHHGIVLQMHARTHYDLGYGVLHPPARLAVGHHGIGVSMRNQMQFCVANNGRVR